MTVTRLYGGVRRQWVVLVLVFAVTTTLAAAFAASRPVRYSANAQVFVRVAAAQSDLAQLNQGSDYTHAQVASYVELVTSPIVLAKVITELHLSDSVTELDRRVRVDNPLNTVLLNVQVSDPSPTQAAAIANRLVRDFSSFVEQIETPDGRATAPVAVSVTRPATVPVTPGGVGVVVYLVLGALVGLGLGVGFALLRDGMNTSVRTAQDVERVTGLFPLGVVPSEREARRRPLIEAQDQSARAEVYRSLRTNLQYIDLDAPPKVIVVVSALASEGRTTAACNLAIALAAGGVRVALVESDVRRPALSRYLGMSNEVGLTSVLAGTHELEDALVRFGPDDLSVLPAGPVAPNPSELLDSDQMFEVLDLLRRKMDMVVLDSPPLLPVTDAAVLSSAADGALLVVRAGSTRVEQIETALHALTAVHAKLLGTVLNFADGRVESPGYDYSFLPQMPAPEVRQGDARRLVPGDVSRADHLAGTVLPDPGDPRSAVTTPRSG